MLAVDTVKPQVGMVSESGPCACVHGSGAAVKPQVKVLCNR